MVAKSIPSTKTDELRRDYLVDRLPVATLLDKYGCCWNTFHNTLDRFAIQRRGLRTVFTNDSFFDELSYTSAWALGLWITDGSVFRSETGGYCCARIGFSDQLLTTTIHRLLQSDCKISFSEKRRHWYFKVTSRKICDRLRDLGVIEKKTFRTTLPDISSELHSHLVRGVFDGDGGFDVSYRTNRQPQIRSAFTSSCVGFLESLQRLISRSLGAHGTISKVPRSSCWRLRFYHRNTLKLAHWMYSNSKNIRYEAKFSRYRQFINNEMAQ